jgi:hypothetical protein
MDSADHHIAEWLNGKGKDVPLHAMETHGERGGIAPAHT